jgi:acetoin utilization protein AcuC
MTDKVCLLVSDDLAQYGFPAGHPFGTDRQAAFLGTARARGLDTKVQVLGSRAATRGELERFHTVDYVNRVMVKSQEGVGYLDYGDTPAFVGVFEVSSHVVGAALTALDAVMARACKRSFQPIGGLHHARRDRAAGFCVFNDVGVVIETLRNRYGVKRIAYVDIDVHHGDGLYYPYESDPDVIIADIHEDGDYLYPGTGHPWETGKGVAAGTKLNIAMPPGAGDAAFHAQWEGVEAHLAKLRPDFFLLQCGADSLSGDPIAHLRYTAAAHGHAARRLCALADEYAGGRLMAFGGGGYNRSNLALAWNAVLEALIEAP